MSLVEDSADNCERLFPPDYTCPPGSPQLGTARYYTMKSVYRGKDEERQRAIALEKPQADVLRPDNKEFMEAGFATFDMGSVNNAAAPEPNFRPQTDLVKRHQYYFRMKGLEFNQLHSINRNKEERLWNEACKVKSTARRPRRRHKLEFDRFKLPPIVEKSTSSGQSHMRQDRRHLLNSLPGKERKTWEQRILELVNERTLTANKRRPEQRTLGRSEGKLVSSRRMRQILDGPQVLSAGNFYHS